MSGMRRVGAVLAGGVALLFAALALIDLYDAAVGDTGDTSREVPLVFGIVFAVLAVAAGLVARSLRRRH